MANKGVFSVWEEAGVFDNVYIDTETNAIAWNEDVDMCPDSLFLTLKNTTFSQWKETQISHAYH